MYALFIDWDNDVVFCKYIHRFGPLSNSLIRWPYIIGRIKLHSSGSASHKLVKQADLLPLLAGYLVVKERIEEVDF